MTEKLWAKREAEAAGAGNGNPITAANSHEAKKTEETTNAGRGKLLGGHDGEPNSGAKFLTADEW